MTSPILVAVFTIAYLAVTVWLCRGLKLNARNLAMGGLACALTLILGSIMIPLPTGASITCGSWIPQNAWDGWGAWGYSLTYHISSKIPEGIFSLVILMILPLGALRKAAKGVSRV